MRYLYIAVTIVALSLTACSGTGEPASGPGPESTGVETPEYAEPSPTGTAPALNSPENTLVETPEYTGVIFSKNGALAWGFLFGKASTKFWEPSVNDVSRAEACIREFLESARQDPTLADYQKENAAFVLENLEGYRRQYVGVVVDGEKRIWCNSFSFEDLYPDWMRSPVYVIDGGKDYWEIEYVLPRDECINFHVHGEA